MRTTLALAALLVAAVAPARAQTAAAPASVPVISPARDAAAARVVDRLWPLGTYRRMMDGTMSKMMDSMVSSMFGMKASDLGPGGKTADGKTLAQVAEEKDPHFRERMKISMDVMMREMLPVIERIEPSVREALTRIYARDYTEAQLGELDAFLQTPTGQQFGRKWMMSFADPEMTASMSKVMPMLMQAMPGIKAKIEAATAHLPPSPKHD